jgi:uncharacterized protein (TIGR03000 family)
MVPPPKGAPPAAALAPATLQVNLPEGATLTINSVPMQGSTASTRKFFSPPLEPGREYYYFLRAEMNVGGQTVAANSRVTVRAGEQSEVTLTMPVAALSQR